VRVPWSRAPRSSAGALGPTGARGRAAACAVMIASGILGGCVGASPTTSLRVKRAPPTPKDASVTIDDQYVGALAFVAARGVALPQGKHRITVEKAGYFPWDRVVEARQQPIDLDVELTRIPD
jgi:PEGA domain